jgi:hypothetical protein
MAVVRRRRQQRNKNCHQKLKNRLVLVLEANKTVQNFRNLPIFCGFPFYISDY